METFTIKTHVTSLSTRLYRLQQASDLCDLRLTSTSNDLDLHKVVLAAMTDLALVKIRSSCQTTTTTGIGQIKIRDCSSAVLDSVAECLYLGVLKFQKDNLKSILGVLEDIGVLELVQELTQHEFLNEEPVPDSNSPPLAVSRSRRNCKSTWNRSKEEGREEKKTSEGQRGTGEKTGAVKRGRDRPRMATVKKVVLHGSSNSKCEACINGFTTEEEMMNHLRIHFLYCCNFCPLNTNSWTYYKKHVREHCKATLYVLTWKTGEKVHECSKYVDGFDNIDDLEVHFVKDSSQKFKESYLEYVIDMNGKQASKDHIMRPDVTKPTEENNETQGEAYDIISEDVISQTALTSHHVPSVEKPHLCPVCKKGFSQAGIRNRHMRVHTGEKPHLCLVCQKGFSQAWNVKEHMKIHNGEKPHLCPVCKKGFRRADDMKGHIRIHNGEKLHLCPVCKKGFSQAGIMNRHMRVHTGEKPHLCPVCQKGFSQAWNVKEHMKIHNGEKPHLCPVCQKSFSRADDMKGHIRIHTGEKPHICPVCKKGFRRACLKQKHMRVHTGKKCYLCPVCKKGFSQAGIRNRHMRVHTGEKPHLCPVCQKGFSQAWNVKEHMKIHTGEKPHLCPVCKRGFCRAWTMKEHMRIIHTGE